MKHVTKFQNKVYPVRKIKRDPNKKEISKFSNGVYEVVKKIPRGKVMTYAAVAQAVGHPKAYRSVGNALNKNTDPRVPCHRVIRSNGKIGGYRRGTKKKIELLRREGFRI